MLASDLIRTLQGQSHYALTCLDRSDLDITDHEQVRSMLDSIKPDFVINLAAYTAVDICETIEGSRQAFLVNTIGPHILATEAQRSSARIIHISTDYVFDGCKNDGYTPDDVTHPINSYGHSKLSGEYLVRASHPDGSYILRTSWLYGSLPYRGTMGHGVHKNFVNTILRLL